MDQAPVATLQFDDLDDRSYGMVFGVQRSIRYHERRRAWFEVWHNISLTISFFGSSSAAAAVLGQWHPLVAVGASAVSALLLAASLVVGFPRKAALHHSLGKRFAVLEKSIPLHSFSDEEYKELRAQRLEIEQDEPPVKSLLNVLCHYAELRALGGTNRDMAGLRIIPWWRRFFAQVMSQDSYSVGHEDPA